MLNDDLIRSVKKEKVDRIDETPTKLELTEALATKEYKLLGFERLYPAEDDVFIVMVQDTKPIDRKLGTLENPIRSVCLDEFGKELDNNFFSLFYDLLEEFIEPKSKDISNEIFKTVENICHSNGYWWNIKHKCVGTHTSDGTIPHNRQVQ
jgi:hypothetical protein